MRYILFAIFPLLPFTAYCQYDEAKVLTFLTNDQQKEWIFERYQVVMGGSEDCEKGKAYTFKSENKVEYKECADGKWSRTENAFTLEEESSYDWWITIGETRYYLVLTKTSGYHQVKLRTLKDAKSHTDESLDIILKYYLDDQARHRVKDKTR